MPPVKRPPQPPPPNQLRQWRLHRNLKQNAVAAELGIEPSTLGRWENRKSPIDRRFLQNLATIYDCSTSDLMTTNPSVKNLPQIAYNKLKKAAPEIQEKALEIIDVLLKAS